MFFNSKKRIASKIAPVIFGYLRTPFIFTSHLKEDGAFSPPYGFWMDAYILGFVQQLIALFIAIDFNGRAMPTEKKGEIAVQVIMQLAGEDWQQALTLMNKNAMAAEKDKEFERGGNDAATLYGAVTGRLKPDDPDPIVQKAQSLAKSMYADGQALGFGQSSHAALGGAIATLTINQHIKDTFLEEEAA